MYVATGLGATGKRCLSDEQAAEARRLCNCKKYGWPEGPVKGLGQTDISIDLEKGKGDPDPCNPSVRVAMPKDFKATDPCEAASRLTCQQKQRIELDAAIRRQAEKREQRKNEEARSYEDELVAQAAMRQKLLVGGILTAVLVGTALVVYRSTRKG